MARSTRDRSEPLARVRCAIYTRKSTDEGLDQEFNSLDAQREAAEAFIASQRQEGWIALPDRFDDGGFSGGTLDRPALQRLLVAVEAGLVDSIVVYKVDRLSRSLLDFMRIVEVLDRHGVSFVSVTQQFNTTTSMGRLTLNMLLSFAQFEREIIGERIRDKIAAAKRKGKHTGGMPVLGYDTDQATKRLVVNETEAELVRHIFERFGKLGSTTELARELNAAGHRTKQWTTKTGKVVGGRPWNKAQLYRLLNNRKYIGQVEHRGHVYPGEHQAIVSRQLWDAAHRILSENQRVRGNRTRAETPALLKGIIRCRQCGCAMGPTFTKRRAKVYRYYLCVQASKAGYDAYPVRSVAAGEIEEAVVGQLRAVFRTPELISRTYREARAIEQDRLEQLRLEKRELGREIREVRDLGEDATHLRRRLAAVSVELDALKQDPVTEADVVDALTHLDPVWEELFPAEQARIVRLLVRRVDLHADGLVVRLRAEGLTSLVSEIGAEQAAGAKEAATG